MRMWGGSKSTLAEPLAFTVVASLVAGLLGMCCKHRQIGGAEPVGIGPTVVAGTARLIAANTKPSAQGVVKFDNLLVGVGLRFVDSGSGSDLCSRRRGDTGCQERCVS